jgi:hypothetical protein
MVRNSPILNLPARSERNQIALQLRKRVNALGMVDGEGVVVHKGRRGAVFGKPQIRYLFANSGSAMCALSPSRCHVHAAAPKSAVLRTYRLPSSVPSPPPRRNGTGPKRIQKPVDTNGPRQTHAPQKAKRARTGGRRRTREILLNRDRFTHKEARSDPGLFGVLAPVVGHPARSVLGREIPRSTDESNPLVPCSPWNVRHSPDLVGSSSPWPGLALSQSLAPVRTLGLRAGELRPARNKDHR